MAQNNRVPKQWRLTKEETLTSFEDWKSNLIYSLRQDQYFVPFLRQNIEWRKRKHEPNFGLRALNGRSQEQRVADLENLLDNIANFCPVIKRKTITHESDSLSSIWAAIRLHYGFQTSGANFLDFVNPTFKLASDERPEDLYQRMAAFIDDNLLSTENNLRHDGNLPTENEQISPTLENLIVLLWLERVHPKLPALVKQKYAPELRRNTLYSLRPEISMSIPSLLDELQNIDEARVMRLTGMPQRGFSSQRNESHRDSYRNVRPSTSNQQRQSKPQYSANRSTRPRQGPECSLCRQANRKEYSHWLSKCKFLSNSDRKYMATTRQIMAACNDESSQEDDDTQDSYCDEEYLQASTGRIVASPQLSDEMASTNRVMIKTSPKMNVFFGSSPATITLDCGGEADMIRKDTAIALGIDILPTRHMADQADGESKLKVCGEAHAVFARGSRTFQFSGLVVDKLSADILGATPFLTRNRIDISSWRDHITFADGETLAYSASIKSNDAPPPKIRSTTVLRASRGETVWPGGFIDMPIPKNHIPDGIDKDFAVEPRSFDATPLEFFAPSMTKSVDSVIRLVNSSDTPKVVKRHEHLCQISEVLSPVPSNPPTKPLSRLVEIDSQAPPFSDPIQLDKDNILSPHIKTAFKQLHKKYDSVFDPAFGTYNHAFGKFEAVVNMGPVLPPQRKGHLPHYSQDKMSCLQDKFDTLTDLGVFAIPSQIDIPVEYLNPSFLVKKQNASDSFRLVTAFNEVAKYCKPNHL